MNVATTTAVNGQLIQERKTRTQRKNAKRRERNKKQLAVARPDNESSVHATPSADIVHLLDYARLPANLQSESSIAAPLIDDSPAKDKRTSSKAGPLIDDSPADDKRTPIAENTRESKEAGGALAGSLPCRASLSAASRDASRESLSAATHSNARGCEPAAGGVNATNPCGGAGVSSGESERRIVCGDGCVVGWRVLSVDPPVLLFENLLSADECAALIALGGPRWIPSLVGNSALATVTTMSRERTSLSASVDYDWPVVRKLHDRLRHMSGLETIQLELIQYTGGQEFRLHHDGAERRYTFVVYLNDLSGEDDGGETVLPHLKLQVKPRRGSALYFRNCRVGEDGDGDLLPATPDNRVTHAALPVRRPPKFIVNAWAVPAESFRRREKLSAAHGAPLPPTRMH